MKKYLIIIYALLVTLFFLSFIYNTSQESKKELVEIESLRKRVLLQSHFSGFYRLPKGYTLQSLNGDSKGIEDIFSDLTIVLYINYNQCDSCIDESIERIENQSQKNDKMKCMIISRGFSLRDLKLLKMSKNIKSDIFLLDNDKLPFFNKMDEALFPYFFTVDSDFEISNIFFPIKSSLVLEDKYFTQFHSK